MSSIIGKIWKNRWMLRSLPYSIYFNIHYLPFKQAICLPIILYKPKLLCCKGSVVISANNIRTGMIRLGKNIVSIYPNSGIVFENMGGVILFDGTCQIGNNSSISIGKTGCVEFGNNFCSTTTLRLASFYSIIFGENVSVGWDCLFMDTDFHKITIISGGYSKGFGNIKIGKNNWIGAKTIVLKNTETPDHCIVAARSLLNKRYDFPSYSLIGLSSQMEMKCQGLWRNLEDDKIEFELADSLYKE